MKENEPVTIKSEGILNSVEQQLTLVRRLQNVYDRRPNPQDFVGAMADDPKFKDDYSEEKIKEDIQYVKEKQADIEKANSAKGMEIMTVLESGFSLSEMMQAMIVDLINKGMFPGFRATMSSLRDDLKVGIDAVIKKKDTDNYLGAAFDFTISADITRIQDKLEKVWNYNVERHSIPTLKYFEDPDTHKKGSLMVPKFIIGGSKKEIEFFAQKYLEGNEAELNDHPFKYLMIKQIDEQLNTALNYFAEQEAAGNTDFKFIQSRYKKIGIFMEDLKKESKYADFIKTKEFFEYKKSSIAYNAIRDFCLAKQSE